MKRECMEMYCTGCGLCSMESGVRFLQDDKGFRRPVPGTEAGRDFMELVCPAGGRASSCMSGDEIWGAAVAVYKGWSSNRHVRDQASSGGVLTELCCYLLEHQMVDGIIQTRAGREIPYSTETVVSRTAEEVRACMGSRYSVSSPLASVRQLLVDGERYAFVGKPCDASALRMYLTKDNVMAGQIAYIFSFFCAGMPSNDAQKRLLRELGCEKESDCVCLKYRGDGWPGFATAFHRTGRQTKMTYQDSWGKILGRDVCRSCRVCLDGIGEFADISCGDLWYMTEDRRPDFSENDGRNVIFARTPAGNELVQMAYRSGDLVVEAYDEYKDELKDVQKYQFERRVCMGSMLAALRLFGRTVPRYDRKIMRKFARNAPFGLRCRRFMGTVKRIVKRRI